MDLAGFGVDASNFYCAEEIYYEDLRKKMSASPVARQATNCQNIPSRRVIVHDASQLPHDYSSTPGGTLFSTTPGGTRIVYEKNFIMNLRQSPLSRTPPKNFETFPDTMINGSPTGKSNRSIIQSPNKLDSNKDQTRNRVGDIDDSQEQFQMDM